MSKRGRVLPLMCILPDIRLFLTFLSPMYRPYLLILTTKIYQHPVPSQKKFITNLPIDLMK